MVHTHICIHVEKSVLFDSAAYGANLKMELRMGFSMQTKSIRSHMCIALSQVDRQLHMLLIALLICVDLLRSRGVKGHTEYTTDQCDVRVQRPPLSKTLSKQPNMSRKGEIPTRGKVYWLLRSETSYPYGLSEYRGPTEDLEEIAKV